MSERPLPSTSEVYYFLKLVDRVSDGDGVHRQIEALSADQRSAVAREVLERIGDADFDDMGRYLIKETIVDALRKHAR
jgi:hypothetical protein